MADRLQRAADVAEHLADLLAAVGDAPLREHDLRVVGEQVEDAPAGRGDAAVVERLEVLQRDRQRWRHRAADILDLFADDAQVYFPKWGLAGGKKEIGKLFGDVGGTITAIVHHYSHFNWVIAGDTVVCEGTSHGEHRDGPWRAGVPEWARRPVVRRLRDP